MNTAVWEMLLTHLARYPGMEAQDCIKLLYQGELGGGHLMEDEVAFAENLRRDMAEHGLFTAAPYGPEPVGGGLCRVYLSAMGAGPAPATLARLCLLSAKVPGSEAALRHKLRELRDLTAAGQLPLHPRQAADIDAYLVQSPLPQPRHSHRYRALYRPGYRLLRCDIAFYLPVFAAIDRALAQRPHVLVGIDGLCASGKSRLSGLLATVYGCGVVHADDFFLQPHKRTPTRLAQAGGNIDWERLAPVARKAGEDRAFSYTAYDCQTGEMGETRTVPAGPLCVLEGAYCLHPKVAAPCDVRVFLSVDARVQGERLLARCGPALAVRFAAEWVPMENTYFSAFGIRQGCDVILDTTRLSGDL